MDRFLEAVNLGDGIFLQAGPKGFRVHRMASWTRPPDCLLPKGDLEITRQLMAGAFFAGLPENGRPHRPRDILLGHIHGLAGAYRTTGGTPAAERIAAQRLEKRGHLMAAAWRRHVAKEESGHDVLALKDIAALGLQPEIFFERLKPPAALAMRARQRGLAESDEPIAVAGYAYVLERWSLFITAQVVEAVERAMPPGVHATRCLRVHSAVGSDRRHVEQSLDEIAGLPASDRAMIAREAFETQRLFCRADDYPGDDAMRDLLAEFGWRHLHLAKTEMLHLSRRA